MKFGLMKNLIKAMGRNDQGFLFLKNILSRVNDAKIKEGIVAGS